MNSSLVEITSPQQQKNGTRMFKCTRTGSIYGSYASGYVRRKENEDRMFYQLNKKIFSTSNRISYSGKSFLVNTVKREMIMLEEDRLNLIEQRASKYRLK
jgi:hypothetical protein